ncbi:MAG: hypothetical protein ACP5VN_03055 [Acidobacteriota bacterium]
MRTAIVLAAAALVFASCSSEKTADLPPPPLTRKAPAAEAQGPRAEALQAVRAYLKDAKQMDVEKMTLEIREADLSADKGTCTVAVGLREMPGAAPMAFTYELVRKDGVWTVASSRPAAGEAHGMPPSGTTSPHGAASPDLPAGHPPVEGGATQPGHGASAH